MPAVGGTSSARAVQGRWCQPFQVWGLENSLAAPASDLSEDDLSHMEQSGDSSPLAHCQTCRSWTVTILRHVQGRVKVCINPPPPRPVILTGKMNLRSNIVNVEASISLPDTHKTLSYATVGLCLAELAELARLLAFPDHASELVKGRRERKEAPTKELF